MPLDPTTVYDIASDLLTSVASRLEDAGLIVPARRYVHAGEIAWDCEQLVVSGGLLSHAFPGEAAKVEFCSPPRHVRFEVSLARCVPSLTDDGGPPPVDDLDAAASSTLADLWSLSYVLWAGYRAGEWASPCHTLLLGPVAVVGPDGGFTAVVAEAFLLIT